MSQPIQPSDIYKAFTWPRLIAIANILFETRSWVAADAKPERGDSLCGIGFRAWEQSKHFVMRAAATEFVEWLSITDGSSTFKFQLDRMPIRFCRGDDETPLPENYATPDEAERAQTELAFATSGQPVVEGIFRLVVQADRQGFPLGVFLLHVNLDGHTIMSWLIPRAEDGTGVAPIIIPHTPVLLPALEIESVDEAAAREREEERVKAEQEKAAKEEAERRHNNDKGA